MLCCGPSPPPLVLLAVHFSPAQVQCDGAPGRRRSVPAPGRRACALRRAAARVYKRARGRDPRSFWRAASAVLGRTVGQ